MNANCQENERNVCPRRENRCCRIPYCVICFLVLVFFFALGAILGAVYYETIVPVLASLIAFTAAVLVIIIALLLYRHCRRSE